jgi:hypothetical protein
VTKKEILSLLCEIIEVPEGSLHGDESFDQFPSWNSMAKLGFIVMMEEKTGAVVDGAKVGKAKTILELMTLVSTNLEDAH